MRSWQELSFRAYVNSQFRGGKVQEYRKITITKDEIRPVAQRMRDAGVHLAMIHAFLDENGKGNVSYEYEIDPAIESYPVEGENVLEPPV